MLGVSESGMLRATLKHRMCCVARRWGNLLNILKPSDYFKYCQDLHSKIVDITLGVCVL